MAKIRQIFQSVIFICLFSGFVATSQEAAALKAEYPLAPLTQTEPADEDLQISQDIPESFELIAENAGFQLYADKVTLAFKVVDKRSGYVWHSNLDEKGEEDRLNKTWTAFAQSGISIDYLDPKAVDNRASITSSEHTLDFNLIDQGFEATVNFIDPSISLAVIVRLEPNGVSVEVPFESIKEDNEDFNLGMLHVYPFFGATRGASVPGYMFIPDGTGSLIRFSEETKAENMYYGRYYGPDLGMIVAIPFDPTLNRPHQLSIPVIGMVHGEKQNAYISIVEKGATYGEIHAHPSGIITNFNFLYNAFVYNQSFFQATNRSGAGVTTIQPDTNAFDVKIQYRFLTEDDSDYVGMAKSYQQYLIDRGALKKVSEPGGDVGIRLEFLGAEKEKVLFWYRIIPMTTIAQMGDILEDLDVSNPDVVYYGWQPFGASTMYPQSLKLEDKLGSLDELRSLIEKVTAEGGNFYLYLDPQAALRDEKGYSPRHDLAMSITNINLIGYNRNKVNFFLNYAALKERIDTLSDNVFSELNAGLALDTFGSMVFSDFKNRNLLNREDAIPMYQSLLAENDGKKSFYKPNDYMFGYMESYYDIPLSNNGYIYTTDVVPFLQVVLAGYIPYYGTALNFSSNVTDDLLRHVDYGVYPSFFLSHEATAKMLNTESNWIYTSSYNQWGDEIERTYQWLNGLLSPVKGYSIVSRRTLEQGVIATTYSNGKQIIVNYNNEPFSAGGIVVESKDALIREVNP